MQHKNYPIIEFGVTEAALAELADRFSVVPDCSNKDGYEQARKALKVLTPLRTSIEKKRKELKADALEYGRMVDSEAKAITEAIFSLESPIKEAKKAIDDEKKRKNQERLDRLKEKVDAIRSLPLSLIGMSSSEISSAIDELDAKDIDDFYDMTKEAAAAKEAALAKMSEMLVSAIQSENLAEQQAELEAKMASQQEQIDRQKNEIDAKKQNESKAPSGPIGAPGSKQSRPSYDEIISVIATHYLVEPAVAARWISEINQAELSKIA